MKIYRIISRYRVNKLENDDLILSEYTNLKTAKKEFNSLVVEEDQLILEETDSMDEFCSSIELFVREPEKGVEDEFIIRDC